MYYSSSSGLFLWHRCDRWWGHSECFNGGILCEVCLTFVQKCGPSSYPPVVFVSSLDRGICKLYVNDFVYLFSASVRGSNLKIEGAPLEFLERVSHFFSTFSTFQWKLIFFRPIVALSRISVRRMSRRKLWNISCDNIVLRYVLFWIFNTFPRASCSFGFRTQMRPRALKKTHPERNETICIMVMKRNCSCSTGHCEKYAKYFNSGKNSINNATPLRTISLGTLTANVSAIIKPFSGFVRI